MVRFLSLLSQLCQDDAKYRTSWLFFENTSNHAILETSTQFRKQTSEQVQSLVAGCELVHSGSDVFVIQLFSQQPAVVLFEKAVNSAHSSEASSCQLSGKSVRFQSSSVDVSQTPVRGSSGESPVSLVRDVSPSPASAPRIGEPAAASGESRDALGVRGASVTPSSRRLPPSLEPDHQRWQPTWVVEEVRSVSQADPLQKVGAQQSEASSEVIQEEPECHARDVRQHGSSGGDSSCCPCDELRGAHHHSRCSSDRGAADEPAGSERSQHDVPGRPVMEAMQQLTADHQQLQQMVQTQQHVLNHVITGQGAQMPYQQGNSMPAVLVPSEDEELMGEPANGRWEADRR